MVKKTKTPRNPPALMPGDKIELVATAGPFSRASMEAGARIVKKMGFKPVWDEKVFQRKGFFAGSDEQRARRLTRAFGNQETRAIWCIRGGYGTFRMLRLIDRQLLDTCDKLVVGFSDVTSLLLSLSLDHGLVTIHGPVVTQLPRIPRTHIQWLKRLMTHPYPLGRIPLARTKTLRRGCADGILAGGNLSILASLVGTGLIPSLKGCILFVEDVAESAYSIDRMWQQLLHSGTLDGVRAVVLGELTRCNPSGRGNWSARAVAERAIRELGVPAVSCGAFGHGEANIALAQGVRARLVAHERRVELLDRVVR